MLEIPAMSLIFSKSAVPSTCVCSSVAFTHASLHQVFSSVQYPMLPLQRSVRASPIVFKVPYSPANWFMSPGQILHEWYTNSLEELKLRVPAPVVCYLLPSSLYKLLGPGQGPHSLLCISRRGGCNPKPETLLYKYPFCPVKGRPIVASKSWVTETLECLVFT